MQIKQSQIKQSELLKTAAELTSIWERMEENKPDDDDDYEKAESYSDCMEEINQAIGHVNEAAKILRSMMGRKPQ